MLDPAAAFWQYVLAIHIIGVVVGFGVIFAYPLLGVAGEKLDPRAMPWFHRMQSMLTQRMINPGLAVVLVAGIYLASKLHQWSSFYVQWGLAIAVILGGLFGAYFVPNEKKLSDIAARDVAATAAGEDVQWSAEYQTLRARVAMVGTGASLLVLITIVLMTLQVGA
jgi:uncharacterized membrane protein